MNHTKPHDRQRCPKCNENANDVASALWTALAQAHHEGLVDGHGVINVALALALTAIGSLAKEPAAVPKLIEVFKQRLDRDTQRAQAHSRKLEHPDAPSGVLN